jgi:ABC-type phosphate/phosphonate transport system substrate-binding protein
MHGVALRLVLSVVTLLCVTQIAAQAQLKVGVNASRGEQEALERWNALGQYLSAELQQPVTIVPVKVIDVLAQTKKQDFDLVMVNPVPAVQMHLLQQATPLANVNTPEGAYFAGLIITRQGSGITRARDLRGKKIRGLSKIAAGAYIFQAYHLLQQGIDVYKDCDFQQVHKQDDVVTLIQKGLVDAGFVRTGTLEAMAREGKITLQDFAIVDARTDPSLPFPHTTALYPEWYVMAMPDLDATLGTKIKAALLKLSPASEATKSAKIRGFIEPLSMESLQTAMRALQVLPDSQAAQVR